MRRMWKMWRARGRGARATWTSCMASMLVALATMGAGSPARLSAQGTAPSRPVAAAQWRLSASPTVTIGSEGDSTSEFVRIVRLLRTEDGAIHVGDFEGPLRIFGPDGRFRRSYARRGGGPDEVQFASWLGTWRDTLFVVDPGNARLARLRRDGTLIRTERLAGGVEQWGGVVGRTDAGEWIVELPPLGLDGPQQAGVHRWPVPIAVLASSMQGPPRLLATMPREASLELPVTSGGRGFVSSRPPFGPTLVVATGRRVVWIGDTATDSLRGFDVATGRVVARLRVPWPEVPVTRPLLNAERERRLARNRSKEAKAITARVFDGDYAPRTLPRYGAALVDADDQLWVGAYPMPAAATVPWMVYDAAGRPIASVALPQRFRLFQAGRDWVLGSYIDEDDVETVRLYRLEKR